MSISPVDWIWYPNEGFYSSQCAQYYGSSRRFDQKGSNKFLNWRPRIVGEFLGDGPFKKANALRCGRPNQVRINAAVVVAQHTSELPQLVEFDVWIFHIEAVADFPCGLSDALETTLDGILGLLVLNELVEGHPGKVATDARYVVEDVTKPQTFIVRRHGSHPGPPPPRPPA